MLSHSNNTNNYILNTSNNNRTSRKREYTSLSTQSNDNSFGSVARLNRSQDASTAARSNHQSTSNGYSEHEFKRNKEDEKKLKEAESLVAVELSNDEKRSSILDYINPADTGHYYFPMESRFIKKSHTSFPQAIIDQYDYMEVFTYSGIFPEISRAWITIDNKLFLWNYHDGVEFAMFDQLSQIIISAALIKPRPGTFPKQVRYVIILATPVEIVMLQCLFEDEDVFGDLELVPSKYSVPTDNIHMTKIVGTDSGRVFMCGKDGNLYELIYYAEASWFSSDMTFRCKKINHTLGSLRSFLPSFLFNGASDPIVDIAIDSQRQLLYTLSQKNVISMMELGKEVQSLRHIYTISNILRSCVKTLTRIAQARIDWTPKEFKIKAIYPITSSEATNVVLVAITNHGHRIYFENERNRRLSIKFIRLCPPEIDRNQAHYAIDEGPKPLQPAYKEGQSPKNVRKVYYNDGILLLVDSSPDTDSLIVMNPDTVPVEMKESKRHLNEGIECFQWPQHVFDLAEMPPSFYMTYAAASLYASNEDTPLAGLSEFATQHALPQRKFLCLTRTGLFQFVRTRAVDELRDILINRSRANNSNDLKNFFNKYGIKEACAMCLILACGTNDDIEIYSQNSQLFNQNSFNNSNYNDISINNHNPNNSNNSHHNNSNSNRRHNHNANNNNSHNNNSQFLNSNDQLYNINNNLLSNDLSQRLPTNTSHNMRGQHLNEKIERQATVVFFEYGSVPLVLSQQNQRNHLRSDFQEFGTAVIPPQITFSGKHDSLYLYLSRLLRPVWVWSITDSWDQEPYQQLRFPREQLLDIKTPLDRLRTFIEMNQNMLFSERLDTRGFPRRTDQEEHKRLVEQKMRAQQNEFQSLKNLKFLLDMCIEAFSLLLILSEDEFFIMIINRLSKTDRQQLYNLKFQQLVTDEIGQRMARVLIEAMKDCPDEDHWVERLYKECPHFFGEADLLHYRALENLQIYREKFNNISERERFIQEALKYYHQAAKSRNFPLLQVCRNLREVHYYPGVIELCLYRSELLKNGDISHLIHASDEHEHQLVTRQIKACYDCILQTLDSIVCSFYPEGEEPSPDSLYLEPNDRKLLKIRAIREALKSNDIEFHYRLYMWMLKRKLLNELYELDTPHIIKFLSDREEYVTILVNYYLHKKKYFEVAVLLRKLAHKPDHMYNLHDRSSFLSRALVCIQNAAADAALVGIISPDVISDLTFQLREEIAIAKVQIKMYNTLHTIVENSSQRYDINEIHHQMNELNIRLYDYNELFKGAIHFKLWEICLTIMVATEDHSVTNINQIYDNILKQEIRQCMERNNDWRPAVQAKLQSLGERYLQEGHNKFPVEYLVNHLEYLHYEHARNYDIIEDYVVSTMIKAGVLLNHLVDIYQSMLERITEQTEEAVLFQCASVYHLVKRISSSSNQNPRSTIVLELLNKVATLLNSMSDIPRANSLKTQVSRLTDAVKQKFQTRGQPYM